MCLKWRTINKNDWYIWFDGLSFDFNNNPDKIIKAEETKMCEQRDFIEKREMNNKNNKIIYNKYNNNQKEIINLINDSSKNN